MPGIAEPVLVAAVRSLPVDCRARLRRHLLLGTPVLGGAGDYVAGGAACLAYLAAYDDVPAGTVAMPDEVPAEVQRAYLALARGASGCTRLLRAEREATAEDIVASVEEALR